jgi:small subunit ribosomal protein S6
MRGAKNPEGGEMMKHYESIFILNPSIDEAESEKINLRMQEVVAGNGGEITKVEKWGKRKLAYTVRKQKKGEYVLFQFTGGAATVAELERNFKMTDAVIKFVHHVKNVGLRRRQAAAAAVAEEGC